MLKKMIVAEDVIEMKTTLRQKKREKVRHIVTKKKKKHTINIISALQPPIIVLKPERCKIVI